MHSRAVRFCDGNGYIFQYISYRRYFDFHKVFEPVTERIIANAEKIAKENAMEIESLRNVKAFRKDDKIADILLEPV